MAQEQEDLTQALRELLGELHQLRKDLRFNSKALLSVVEAAHILSLSPKTIRNGLGPKAKRPFPIRPVKFGGKVLFKREDLDRYIASL